MLLDLNYCRTLVDKGYEILPVVPGKAPVIGFTWRNYHSKEDRYAELAKEPLGIGIPCCDQLLCLDFDADADEVFHKFLTQVVCRRDDLAHNCYCEKTPHGYHIVFRTKEAAPNGKKLALRAGDAQKYNEKAERFEKDGEQVTLIETKGEGGYFVAFPTEGYEWLSVPSADGSELSTTPLWNLTPITPEDVDWLLKLARTFHTYEAKKSGKKQAIKQVSPERLAEQNRCRIEAGKAGWLSCNPIEYWGSGCSQERYEQLLEDYDWQKDGMDENGRIQYWRPGLERDSNNHSGNLRFDVQKNCWFLYLFSTLSELPAGFGLPAWQFLMYEQGYTNEPNPRDISNEDKAEWCEDWYEEQAQHVKVFWEPVVDYLHLTQFQFNWRK